MKEKRTLRRLGLLASIGLFSAFLTILYCSSPTDKGALRWRTRLDLPVSNEKFVMKEEFENLFGDMEMRDADSAITGDTLAFTQSDTSEQSFIRKEDSLETKQFSFNLPEISMSSMADISLDLPAGLVPGILPLPVTLHDTAAASIPGVYAATFDAGSVPLRVRVYNQFSHSTANLDSVRLILLAQSGPVAGSQIVTRIAPNDSADILIPVAGQSIDSMARIDIQAKLNAGTQVQAGDRVGFRIMFNGITAQRATIIDSLIPLNYTVRHDYKITDSVDLKYIDLKYGHFTYAVTNSTDLKVVISGEHRNIWQVPYSKNVGAESLADSALLTDTTFYGGDVTQGGVNVEPHSVQSFGRINCSGHRIFPEWDPAVQQSVTRVQYQVQAISSGRRITVAEGDSLRFTIRPATFSFDKFKGVFKQDFVRQSDTDYIAIPFIWENTSKDSLRGRFHLNRVVANVEVAMRLPDEANLSMDIVKFRVFNTKTPAVFCTSTAVFENVKDGAIYNYSFRVDSVVNSFPDSVGVVVTTTVPKDSMVIIVNDQDDTSMTLGQMAVNASIRTRMDAYMDWQILAPITMDLGSGFFPVTDEAVNYFRKAQDRTVAFHLQVHNSSNLNLRIYSLLAPKQKKLEFDSLKSDQFSAILREGTAAAYGYVSLLGDTGIVIPARGQTVPNAIDINEAEINTILDSDTCYWRWQARFEPMTSDALLDTDYIDIRSWLHFDGINNLDSIMSFTKKEE